MRMFFALLRQHLRVHRLSTAIWVAVVALLSYSVVSTATSVTSSNLLEDLLKSAPGSLSRLYGQIFAFKYPVDGFLQFKWFLVLPLLAGIFAVLEAMLIMAREIDRRTADFILTLPVRRIRLLLARFTALALNLAALYAVSLLVIWAGVRALHLEASIPLYAAYLTGQYFLILPFAAFTLWLSLAIGEYGLANRYALIVTVGFWVLAMANRIAGGPHWLDWAFLFNGIDAVAVIAEGRFPWTAVAIGSFLTMALLYLAARIFTRKQVPA